MSKSNGHNGNGTDPHPHRRKYSGLGVDVFTTGQIAKLACVAPRTASGWVDAGRFKGAYRIPGSQDRRVPRASVVAFFIESGMPLPPCFVSQTLLAGVGAGVASEVIAAIPDAISIASLMDLAFAVDPGAGWHTIVLDAGNFGRGDTLSAGTSLRWRLPGANLIGLACEDEPAKVMKMTWMAAGFTSVLACPFPTAALVELMLSKGVSA